MVVLLAYRVAAHFLSDETSEVHNFSWVTSDVPFNCIIAIETVHFPYSIKAKEAEIDVIKRIKWR